MKILRDVQQLKTWRGALEPDCSVAFVPTMGFLHRGHTSLLDEGRRRVPVGGGRLVLSIFVNPTQFGENEDLGDYPRDEARDLELARAHGCDAVFVPSDPGQMYPSRTTWVEVEQLDRRLCGASRPGHFRGVCTVVTKLWNLVRPDVAVFGEKDFQQLAIVRRLHADLFLGGEIVSMPTVRDADGLAMSSRNARLSPPARTAALALPRFRSAVCSRFEQGARDAGALLHDAASALKPGEIDYVELVDAVSLEPVSRVDSAALAAFAVRYGGVRLIDNVVLDP